MKPSWIIFLLTSASLLATVFLLSLNGITNTCSSLATNEQPTSEDQCIRTAMSNFQSCCYVTLSGTDKTTQHACLAVSSTNETTIASQMNLLKQQGFDADYSCPKASKIPNTCGSIGILEPKIKTECSMIIIPESYCCMVTVKKENNIYQACRRIVELPNNKTQNETIISELAQYDVIIADIQCDTGIINTSYIVILLVSLLLF